MPPIGKLDRRITIERMTGTAKNEFNEDVQIWTPLTTVWARRRDASDGEREAAGQIGATLMSRFVIRSTAVSKAVTPVDRISYRGIWNIQGIKETEEGRNRFLEITAIKDAD
ncbi:phage head closure protein [Rhizobium laguerreae]|uniref:phage head closure protein n=1 Tax=Rhizobium laguerreae TaxID=1076926 RepID=UPI001C8FF1F9|nr:phage head closure protein [Rhizobium laguerreae]MBY3257068.1 phage head closure protein [Rhizobium laguerreae]MBY3282429.1 phage head closure protein [Rhizobium laguerreae]MBY3291956.1 phage head closure protein [Rhizobium laguerreae]